MPRLRAEALTALYTRIPASLADSLDDLVTSSGRAKQQVVTELFERALTAGSPPPSGAPGEVLTIDEVAALLRVEPTDVATAIETNGLPGRRVGEVWRFSRTAVEAWLNQSDPRADRAVGFSGPTRTSRGKAAT